MYYVELKFTNNLMHNFFYLFNNNIMILDMFRASHAHLQEDIVYFQYLVSSRSVCCHSLHRLRADGVII
jgi:hypothetical protein